MKFRQVAALALVGSFVFTTSAYAAKTCEEDSLLHVSSSGAVLEMLSGRSYKVDHADRFEASLWHTPNAVLICNPGWTVQAKSLHSYKIINQGANETVHATRLK
jgi:hypothetical protein